MNKLYILVGLPGCGKSTYSRKMIKEGFVVHSSDAIRIELGASTNDRKVFSELRKRMVNNLNSGKNVICDATNVTLSKRTSFLDELKRKKINCEKVAVVFNKDVKTCIAQNKMRDVSAQVPNVAIYTLNSKFVRPTKEEGFDSIIEIN